MKNHDNIITTEDGSNTLFNKTVGEHFHSTFGAIQESEHVFIQTGLDLYKESKSRLKIFEVGFGTGLNALLTYAWAEKNKVPVFYQSVELYPVSIEQAKKLNYPELLGIDQNVFLEMHQIREEKVILSEYFALQKNLISLQELRLSKNIFDLVFFDAFSPDAQPEMWTEDIFQKIANSMKRGGVLTTYSTKGVVKRALKSVGFEIEKLPGPPGKREILRGVMS